MSDYRRRLAWKAGNKAGIAGQPRESNNRQIGTIFYDDWADGWEEGARDRDRGGDLSDRAKAVCGALFGMMSPGKGDVTFHLREGRPSDEAQDGLDELVRTGVISVEPFNEFGGLVYRPLVDCRWAYKWLGQNLKNPAAQVRMTVPLTGEKEAGEHQAKALSSQPFKAGGRA